jgi:hypothetical protein
MASATVLQPFIDRLRALPREKQEAYAAVYLEELDDDERWEELFGQTSEDQWKKMTRLLHERIESEGTISGDQFLNRS